jgi:EAL domain-containing protein (putative c-di-GMP-specific phosphodiesterase class I)/GGDEF domain-containing protein
MSKANAQPMESAPKKPSANEEAQTEAKQPFITELESIISLAKRDRCITAVMLMELQQKENTPAQHNKELIDYITKELGQHISHGDVIKKLSDHKIGIIIQRLNKSSHAVNIAKRLQTVLKQLFSINNKSAEIELYTGIACYPIDNMQASLLVQNAEDCLTYLHQQSDKNIIFYSEIRETNDEHAQFLVTELENAIKKDEFYLDYQPIFELQARTLVGLEALLRWQHPKFGRISPNSFVTSAEKSGLIVPIGDWVVNKALHQYQKWRLNGVDPGAIYINTSALQLNEPNFAKRVIDIAEETGVDPSQINIELTDINYLQNLDQAIETLNELQAYSIHISIDDFGDENTTLTYFETLPINTIKIDQSYINGIPYNENSTQVVRSVLALSETFGINVIAEGIENYEQLDWLTQNGCFYGQGFILCHPLDADEVNDFITHNS